MKSIRLIEPVFINAIPCNVGDIIPIDENLSKEDAFYLVYYQKAEWVEEKKSRGIFK